MNQLPTFSELVRSIPAKTHTLNSREGLANLVTSTTEKLKAILFTPITVDMWTMASKIVAAYAPLQGSDIIFYGLVLQSIRFVIVSFYGMITDPSEWVVLAYDLFIAVIIVQGGIVYFARRVLSSRKP